MSDSIRTKPSTDAYREGWARIFGEAKGPAAAVEAMQALTAEVARLAADSPPSSDGWSDDGWLDSVLIKKPGTCE